MINKFIHAVLKYFGYWTCKRSVLPFGIDYLSDVKRLSALYNLQIHRIVDVGSHTGQSVRAFRENWPEAHILAFEADPDTYKELVRVTSSKRTDCVNLALSDAHAEVEFFRYGSLATCNSLLRDNLFAVHRGINPVGTLIVNSDTLDNVLSSRDIKRVDLLKIDTEGCEYKVLDGAIETLANREVKFVFLEFNRITALNGKQSGALASLGERLEKIGFSFVSTYPELVLGDKIYYSASNALFFRNFA